MAGITHTKVSAKVDGGDASLVEPSDWNADHAVGNIGGTPAPVLSTTNAAGNATTYLRTNDQLALFDATAPTTQAFSDSAAAGSAAVAARRDHKHAWPALGTTAEAVGTSGGGSATTPSKSDHVHATGAGTPSTQAIGDAAAVGTGPAASMTDHKHAMPAFATPAVVLGSAAAAGSAATLVRTDSTIAAFDTTVPSSATSVGAVGTAAFAARRDHQHPHQVSTTALRVFDDMLYGGNLLVATSPTGILGMGQISMSGTSAIITGQANVTVANHPGTVTLGTGTTSLGNVSLGPTVSGNGYQAGGGRMRYGVWLRIPVLGTSAQRFEVNAGFMDNFVTTTITDGMFITYKDTIASGAWQATTSANSVTTATVTAGATVLAATWYLLEVECNAAGTSVSYYVNGSSIATHAANIPVNRDFGCFVCIVKTVGATTSLLDIDAWYLECDFTTPR